MKAIRSHQHLKKEKKRDNIKYKKTDTKPLVSYLVIRLSSNKQEHLLTLPDKHQDSRV